MEDLAFISGFFANLKEYKYLKEIFPIFLGNDKKERIKKILQNKNSAISFILSVCNFIKKIKLIYDSFWFVGEKILNNINYRNYGAYAIIIIRCIRCKKKVGKSQNKYGKYEKHKNFMIKWEIDVVLATFHIFFVFFLFFYYFNVEVVQIKFK